jgi:hypothetical protein
MAEYVDFSKQSLLGMPTPIESSSSSRVGLANLFLPSNSLSGLYSVQSAILEVSHDP